MFSRFYIVLMGLVMFLVCSAPVSALPLGEGQGTVSDATDHIVSELRAKHFFAYQATVPLDQLKCNSIVQMVNKKGYIRYFVYDGLVQTKEGKPIVLLKNNDFQNQRYMTLKKFQKEYTGIIIVTQDSILPADMTREIWEIQGKDLKKKFKSLKNARYKNQHYLTLLNMYMSLNGLYTIHQLQKEISILNSKIKRVEDEMIYLGFIGA